jgi:hypothetical protein
MPLIVSRNFPFQSTNALRFSLDGTTRMSRTFTATGNRRKMTWSVWYKNTQYNQSSARYDAFFSVDSQNFIGWGSTDQPERLQVWTSNVRRFESLALLRDYTSWSHYVIAVDTNQTIAANRCRVYLNGVELENSGNQTFIGLGADFGTWNTNVSHAIGDANTTFGGSPAHIDGIMQNIVFVDGQQLPPSAFGYLDAFGNWRPKTYTGDFGQNGYFLPFTDQSSVANLGRDISGNGNNWTPSGSFSITGFDDSSLTADSSNSNYPILNLNDITTRTNITFQGQRLLTNNEGVKSTIALPQRGKWYWEAFHPTATTAPSAGPFAGIARASSVQRPTSPTAAGCWWLSRNPSTNNLTLYNNGTSIGDTGPAIANETFRFAWDGDNKRLWIGRLAGWYNSSGAVVTNIFDGSNTGTFDLSAETEDLMPIFGVVGSTTLTVNFGQQPFRYAPPPGYAALVAADTPKPPFKPTQAFRGLSRVGTGAAFSNNNFEFQPDLVMIKSRSAVGNWNIYDSVRGTTLQLGANLLAAETTEAQGVTSFNANGFSGGTLAGINTNGVTYSDYGWRLGAEYGFDIVTYAGNGTSNRLINHNLQGRPNMIWVKNRTSSTNWYVWHSSMTSDQHFLLIDVGSIETAANTPWGTGTKNAAQFMVTDNATNNINATGQNYVAYLWREIPGFSKFGIYPGNATVNGPFVWCGFKPAFVLIRRVNVTSSAWVVYDNITNVINPKNDLLNLDKNNALSTSIGLDFLDNGFKLRTTDAALNTTTSGSTYIFYAVAEQPFT